MNEPKLILSREHYDAAIFDLDGVITRTARVHAAAWKAMFDEYLRRRNGGGWEPFDGDADYRRFVDGKPRFDGVRSFLESRGIELPWGSPGDPPEAETVCGLGNRKNAFFLQRLERDGAEVFNSSIDLVRALRRAGLKAAVVSSSRNCAAILRSAGASGLFDARVDGVDLDRRGLKGKPAPDMFLAAARDLGVSPGRAVVVEDALAGVEAGRAGGFGLVIGVDRADQAEALRSHGADVVVKDLAELSVATPDGVPFALEALDGIMEHMGARRPALFLDYDGTLTPIVDRPDLANITDPMREGLRRLARLCPVAVVSGRDLPDVRARVGVDGIFYAGSHGFDIAGPDGGHAPEAAQSAVPELDRAGVSLGTRLAGVPGVLLERKRFCLAVHYRLVDPGREMEVAEAAAEVAEASPRLRLGRGKKVFELLPAIQWDKGLAVNWLRQALHLDGDRFVPIYIGDDVTDEDAFRALRESGIGIAVLETPQPTAARYRLRNPEEVKEFLDALADRLERR